MHLNVFLSFYQICEEHFKGRAKTTVYNRLSKLVRSGFVATMRVNVCATHKDHLDIGVIYKVTKKGLKVVSEYLQSAHVRDDLVPINPSCLYHDLLLTDALRKLKGSIDGLRVINTKVLKVTSKYGIQQPDAILFLPNSNKKIALELELTAKSEVRYRDIITNYQTSLEFEKVIYVTLSSAIHKKIGSVITGHGSRYEFSDTTNNFYFTDVKSLLNEVPLKISNGTDLILTSDYKQSLGEHYNEL
jgi:hypothetical protein